MQLTKGQSLRRALTTATCTLLGTPANEAAAFGTDAPWESDSAILFYSEYDRVTVIEPVYNARKELDSNEYLNLRLVADVLTGASANGAVAMPFAQTFTTPSGESTYQTTADETPLDPSFKDLRAAISADWEKPITRTLRGVYGAYLSREYDYTSLGASITLSKDTEDKNRTYTAAIAFNYDLVSPVGGIPVAMSAMPVSGPKQTSGKDQTKTVTDLLVGVTQILDRQSLLQINYNLSARNGYQTDPYKILSIVDDSSGLLINTDPYRFEARPDNRLSQSLYVKYVHQFTEDVIYFTYRYFWDDWDIYSQTFDIHYRYELGGGHYLLPHARYYQQSSAYFYSAYLLNSNAANTQIASADYRLGDMSTTTLGLLYGLQFNEQSEFTIRAEVMQQSGKEPAKFGALDNQTLFPDVDAIILQAGYRFIF